MLDESAGFKVILGAGKGPGISPRSGGICAIEAGFPTLFARCEKVRVFAPKRFRGISRGRQAALVSEKTPAAIDEYPRPALSGAYAGARPTLPALARLGENGRDDFGAGRIEEAEPAP